MIVMFIALNRRILSKKYLLLTETTRRRRTRTATRPPWPVGAPRRETRARARPTRTVTRQHCLRPGGARTTPTTSTLGYGPLCFALHLSFRVVHLLPLCSLSALYFLAPLLSSSHLRTSQIKHP